MQKDILPRDRDPLGGMLEDYLAGDTTVSLTVASPLLEMSEMDGATMFRGRDGMDVLELAALDYCRGKVLDVGAGSGCHSLVLQEKGLDVTAMDISPGCITVMAERGVKQRICGSLFNIREGNFNTLLMLMNGIGICGTIDGLNYFFQHIRSLLKPGGQVLADSTDLTSMHTSLPLMPDEGEKYYGETEFVMSYKAIKSDPFDWLYVDYATLDFYAEFHGWKCEQLMMDENGKFLARIY